MSYLFCFFAAPTVWVMEVDSFVVNNLEIKHFEYKLTSFMDKKIAKKQARMTTTILEEHARATLRVLPFSRPTTFLSFTVEL